MFQKQIFLLGYDKKKKKNSNTYIFQVFLNMITGDVLNIEEKYHSAYAKKWLQHVVMCSNGHILSVLEKVKDKTGEYLRRLLLMPFNVPISEEDRDDKLDSKLEEEIVIILIAAIRAYKIALEITKNRSLKLFLPERFIMSEV